MRMFLSFLALLLFAGNVLSQQATDPMAGMNHTTVTNIIDGKVHPELIGDPIAYQLFFLAATSDLDNVQYFFAPAKPSSEELVKIQTIMYQFRVNFDRSVKEFNDQATLDSKAGKPVDQKSIQNTIDLLVSQTKTDLQNALRMTASAWIVAAIIGYVKIAACDLGRR